MSSMDIMSAYFAQSSSQSTKAGKAEKKQTTETDAKQEMAKAAYGAEADFAVSGRAREVAVQSQYAWLEEQNKALEESEKAEEKSVKGKEEETEFQKMLKKKLEEAKSLDTMFQRMRELNEKAQKKNSQKKKLGYSYRRVSASISSAKTTTQASLALSSASANLSSIRRKAASGQYADKEIEMALAHAQKMVRVARKKVQNIKWETQQSKRNRSRENAKKQENATIHQTSRRSKEEKALLRMKVQLKAQENAARHKNRREEDMKLMTADMQYLQRKIDLLKQESHTITTVGKTELTGLTDEMAQMATDTQNMQAAADAVSAEGSAGEQSES